MTLLFSFNITIMHSEEELEDFLNINRCFRVRVFFFSLNTQLRSLLKVSDFLPVAAFVRHAIKNSFILKLFYYMCIFAFESLEFYYSFELFLNFVLLACPFKRNIVI